MEILAQHPAEELVGMSFFSADVTALYTNINIQGAVSDVMSMAEEHIEDLDTWGMSLGEIGDLLLTVLENSYFVFNKRLYKQLVGLFMGCKPSPLCAIVRVYMFEKRSLYVDTHFISRPTSSYSTVDPWMMQVQLLLPDMVSAEDPDGLLKWELDFPSSSEQFVPFLDAEIRIDKKGKFHYRYYIKPQKKNITLHAKSDHITPCRSKFIPHATSIKLPAFARPTLTLLNALFRRSIN